jgi:hypothetical protein
MIIIHVSNNKMNATYFIQITGYNSLSHCITIRSTIIINLYLSCKKEVLIYLKLTQSFNYHFIYYVESTTGPTLSNGSNPTAPNLYEFFDILL